MIFHTRGNMFVVASWKGRSRKKIMCTHTTERGDETSDRLLQMVIYSVVSVPPVIPKRRHDLKRQPSARVSQTVRYSYPSHVITVTMFQRPSVHLGPTSRCCKTRQYRTRSIGIDLAASYSILAVGV